MYTVEARSFLRPVYDVMQTVEYRMSYKVPSSQAFTSMFSQGEEKIQSI